MELHALGAFTNYVPHHRDATTGGSKSMEEGIVLVHGFRTCGPWLLDSIHLSETVEEETWKRNLHFLMAKKQRIGPKGARHNTPSRTGCQ